MRYRSGQAHVKFEEVVLIHLLWGVFAKKSEMHDQLAIASLTPLAVDYDNNKDAVSLSATAISLLEEF